MKINVLYIFILSMSLINCSKETQTKTQTLFVGTYTDTESEGIYRMQFDTITGSLSNTELAAKIINPSFLAISKEKDFLYTVQERNDFDNGSGAVTAFALQNDSLSELQTLPSFGAHPCHISISPEADKLAVSNYTGGNASIYKIGVEGKLAAPSALMNHNTIDTTKTAHAHMAQWIAGDIFITDLGLDAVLQYEDTAYKIATPKATIALPKGAGPRHFASTQNGKYLYVINELNSSISVFQRNVSGEYVMQQNISTLAEDYEGENSCADIHISDDGWFLYGSNRGENTIGIFSIDQQNGRLSAIGRQDVHGDWPRNFTLDPTGKFLLVANQKSNNISVFKRDLENGTLRFLNETKLPKPVCLVFL